MLQHTNFEPRQNQNQSPRVLGLLGRSLLFETVLLWAWETRIVCCVARFIDERQPFSQASSSCRIINFLDSKEASIAARHYHTPRLAFYVLPCCWNPRLYSVNPVHEPREQSCQNPDNAIFYGRSPVITDANAEKKTLEVLRSSSLLLAGCFQSLHYNYTLPDSYLVDGSLHRSPWTYGGVCCSL